MKAPVTAKMGLYFLGPSSTPGPLSMPKALDAFLRASIEDITEKKLAAAALAESEARYRELCELLPEIVFEVDQDFILTFINKSGLDYLEMDYGQSLTGLDDKPS